MCIRDRIWWARDYWTTVLFYCLMTIFFYGTTAVKFTFIAENFPARLRATGVTFSGSLAVNRGIATGPLAGVCPGDRFRGTRENPEPRAMAGWTHHYFDVDEGQYDRYLNEARRIPPSPEGEEFCGLSSGGEMNPPGIGTPFESASSPAGPRVSGLGVAPRKGTALQDRVGEGRCDIIQDGGGEHKGEKGERGRKKQGQRGEAGRGGGCGWGGRPRV